MSISDKIIHHHGNQELRFRGQALADLLDVLRYARHLQEKAHEGALFERNVRDIVGKHLEEKSSDGHVEMLSNLEYIFRLHDPEDLEYGSKPEFPLAKSSQAPGSLGTLVAHLEELESLGWCEG